VALAIREAGPRCRDRGAGRLHPPRNVQTPQSAAGSAGFSREVDALDPIRL